MATAFPTRRMPARIILRISMVSKTPTDAQISTMIVMVFPTKKMSVLSNPAPRS